MLAVILLSIITTYLVLTGFIALFVTRFSQSKKWKRINGFLVFLMMMLLPVADMLPGYIYYKNLCMENSGLTIYRHINANGLYLKNSDVRGVEYKIKHHNLKFIEIQGEHGYVRYDLNHSGELVVANASFLESIYMVEENRNINMGLDVKKSEILIKEMSTGEVISSSVKYIFLGGWLSKQMNRIDSGSFHCPVHLPDVNQLIFETRARKVI